MESRLIIEQFDPWRPKPGGIDTCIRGIIKYAPADTEILIAGIDAIGDKEVGRWYDEELYGRKIKFIPLARLDNANLRRAIPHSVRLSAGLARYRPAQDVSVIQTHRINMGLFAKVIYRNNALVELVHSSGHANLGRGSKSFFRWAPFLYRAVERATIKVAREVFVFSRSGAERMRQIGSNVYFSPTWFDPDEFYVDPERSDGDIARRSILWACRVEPAKNPLLAIEAFARLSPEFRLTVAGDGTLMEQMKEAATSAGISSRVVFLGSVSKSEMGSLMRKHDILLMTSRFEGFSRSIVEALACGLPVVTTPGGEPNGLVIHGENGARFESADTFADAVDVAASLHSEQCRKSVADLRADNVVARIFAGGVHEYR